MLAHLLFLCSLAFWSMLAAAALPPIDIAITPTVTDLARRVEVHVAPDPTQTLDAILALPPSAWRPNDHDAIHAGMSIDDRWVRIPLTNSSAESREVLLKIGWAQLDVADVYVLADGTLVKQWATGDHRPFTHRPLPTRTFVFPIDVPSGSTREVVMKLGIRQSLFEPIRLVLYDPPSFHAADTRVSLFYGIFYGALLVLVLYHLFLFGISRQRVALDYALYLGSLTVWHLDFVGFGQQYLWTGLAWWNNNLFLSGCVHLAALSFVTRFLQLPEKLPRLNLLLWTLLGVIGVHIALELGDPHGQLLSRLWLVNSHLALNVLLAALTILAGVLLLRRDARDIRYFLLGWGCLVASLGIYALVTSFPGLLPLNDLTENSIAIGSALQFVMLGLALASRVRQLRETAQLSQILLDQEKAARAEQQTFLATVSHELRTPLAVVDTITQNLMLDTDGADPEQTRQRHEKILQATARLTGVLDNYLDEYRFSLLREARARTSCKLTSLMQEAACAGRQLADRQMINVAPIDCADDFLCDAEATRLALHNLVDNAVRHTPPGTIIRLSAGRAGQRVSDGVWIEVADDGPGIAQAEIEQRWAVPVASQPTAGTGKGLGLLLARRMIEQQGGRLTADCAPGMGCRFRLSLPG